MDRYLRDTLQQLQNCTSDVAVFDDQSDDGTLEYARTQEVHVARRPNDVPSFADDEAAFREAAWRSMEELAKPTPRDWILCLDADEFIVGDTAGDTPAILTTITASTRRAIGFPVLEVFGFDERLVPLIRRDGFWAATIACRLVQWRPGGTFGRPPHPRGSVPGSWMQNALCATDLSLLHLGYARPADRKVKHQRYLGDRWHNPKHVDSILQPGRLTPWTGERPALRQTRFL